MPRFTPIFLALVALLMTMEAGLSYTVSTSFGVTITVKGASSPTPSPVFLEPFFLLLMLIFAAAASAFVLMQKFRRKGIVN